MYLHHGILPEKWSLTCIAVKEKQQGLLYPCNSDRDLLKTTANGSLCHFEFHNVN